MITINCINNINKTINCFHFTYILFDKINIYCNNKFLKHKLIVSYNTINFMGVVIPIT
jgi:hypothetical protein